MPFATSVLLTVCLTKLEYYSFLQESNTVQFGKQEGQETG